jgi:hypothetical protein
VKNITVSVPDDVYRVARITAAERGTSVSALVAAYLRSVSNGEGEDEFERLLRKQQELLARVPLGFRASDRLSREELYEDALRRHEHPPVRGIERP